MPLSRTAWFLSGCLCLIAGLASADEWPQWRGPNRDGVWKEQGLVSRFAGKQLKLDWRAPIGSGYSGPTVALGRVYVTDRQVEPKQVERVHCFDAQSGKPIWTQEYERTYEVDYTAGPRASVTIDEGRAFSIGAMGDLYCINAVKGNVVWKKDLLKDYKIRMPIWGIAASPLVDGDLVIVQIGGEKGACLVAFNKRSGDEKWRALDDDASYSSPIVIEQAGKRVLVCWTGDSVAGLNPQSGEVYWRLPFKHTKMVINIPTPVVDQNRLFLTSFYDGSEMIKLATDKVAAEEAWHRLGPDEQHTDSLHAIIGTPYLHGDYVYGVDSYGELRCLDVKTGDRIWENLKATPKARWSTIHMVQNGDRTWMFNERGELIIAKLSPQGYEEISRAKLIEPTMLQLGQRKGVCWAHPAYAYKHVFARNDEELVSASLQSGSN